MRISPLIDRPLIWMRYPSLRKFLRIPTHLTDREKVCLYERAVLLSVSEDRGPSVVEIGSYLGASSCFLAAGLEESAKNGRVHCVDTWSNDAMSEGGRDTMQEFLANTDSLKHRINPIRGWSTEVRDDVAKAAGAIDLLFIDGDHSYEGCLADWQTYAHLLSESAVVVMHDVGWAEGVQRVIREEIQPNCVSEGRLPNLWWGQVKCD